MREGEGGAGVCVCACVEEGSSFYIARQVKLIEKSGGGREEGRKEGGKGEREGKGTVKSRNKCRWMCEADLLVGGLAGAMETEADSEDDT